jgi:hypothetical protein
MSMALMIDSAASQIVEEEIFERADWEFTPEGGLASPPEPGTWCRRREGWDPRIGAAFCCPACCAVRFLVTGIHKVDPLGKVTPDLQCKAQGCGFHRKVTLKDWLKKPLYTVVVLRRKVDGSSKREDVHVHALTREEALFHAAVRPPDAVVEVGLTIGAFEGANGSGTLDLKHARIEKKKIRSAGGLG